MDTKEIEKRFTYHSADLDQTMKMENIRKHFTDLAKLINDLCPDSREKSLSLTELETSQFWANASIVRNTDATSK